MTSQKNTRPLLRTGQLAAVVNRFVAKVVTSPEIESAWLSGLSHLEDVAAQQIRRNVSTDTPVEFLAEIESHAADESRHALEFTRMRPIPEFQTRALLELEKKIRRITGSFGMGYFGNPVLVTARNRHVAYVHGALTIEQFPYQLYTAYLKATKLPQVQEALPGVLADESVHLALGGKMRKEISEEDRLSLQELNEIEKDMCLKLVERLERVVGEYTGEVKPAAEMSLARRVNTSDAARTAWTFALAHAEALAMEKVEPHFVHCGHPLPAGFAEHKQDEIRHSHLLRQSVASLRRKQLSTPGYLEMENQMIRAIELYVSLVLGSIAQISNVPEVIYPVGALMLEMMVLRHYSEFLQESDDILTAHILGVILFEEAEHARNAHALVRKLPEEHASLVARARKFEEKFFARLGRQVALAVDAFENSVSAPSERPREAMAVS